MLSVVVPAFNESEKIEANVLEMLESLERIGYDVELIVVDDGSTDSTVREALRAKAKHPEKILVVRCEENAGKGNALLCGTRYATREYVVFADADLDIHPRQITTFFEVMAAENADAVIGSKYHPKSDIEYPRWRKVNSIVYFSLVRALFGLPIRDSQTGLKLFKRAVLVDAFPRVLVKRFGFDIELLVNVFRLGYTIGEAPVVIRFQRPRGRLRLRDIRRLLQDTLAVFYRTKIGYYDRTPGGTLESLPAVRKARLVELPSAEPTPVRA